MSRQNARKQSQKDHSRANKEEPVITSYAEAYKAPPPVESAQFQPAPPAQNISMVKPPPIQATLYQQQANRLQQLSDSAHFFYNVAIIGDPLVGKSELIRVETGEIKDRQSLGVQVADKVYQHDEMKYCLRFVDIPGETRFLRMLGRLCSNTAANIYVFNVHNRSTFEHIQDWDAQFRSARRDNDSTTKILVGNVVGDTKVQPTVDDNEAHEFADQHDMMYFQTNTVTGEGVATMFEAVISAVASTIPQPADPKHLVDQKIKLNKRLLGSAEYQRALFADLV